MRWKTLLVVQRPKERISRIEVEIIYEGTSQEAVERVMQKAGPVLREYPNNPVEVRVIEADPPMDQPIPDPDRTQEQPQVH